MNRGTGDGREAGKGRVILGVDDVRLAQRAKAAGWLGAAPADVAEVIAAWEGGRFHLLSWPAERITGPAFGLAHGPDRRGAGRPAMPGVTALLDTALAAGEPAMLAMIAVWRLDLANAAHGRASVDKVLGAIEERLRSATESQLGAPAIVERVGGAEFMIAAACGPEAASAAAAAIDAALAQAVTTDNGEAMLGFRLGLALSEPGDSVAAVLGRAEAAMLGSSTREAGSLIEALAVELHHALGRDEIGLRFQPQVEIASGAIVGVEALVRWEHPTLGDLGAEMLLTAAARAGLAVALSDRIQTLVLTRAAGWTGALAGLRVSLNLEASDLVRPGFAALFLERVERSGFSRERLTVEVTETGLIRDLDAVAAVLAELRGAGCRVAIDDFGTGYSSLAYLQALPLDCLKVDKLLVRDIEGSARDQVVVRGVIDIARALGLTVIAEGVETEGQRDLLTDAGCDIYQGFLTAGPLDERALARLMDDSRSRP